MSNPSRRTTLGPISQSAINSRLSMGRPSMGPPRAASRISMGPSEGNTKPPRASLAPNNTLGLATSNRRSSVGADAR